MIERYKYPRISHLPWSESADEDDIILNTAEHFAGRTVVITEKMDGENTTVYYNGYTHARSCDASYHESRTWMKAEAARIGHQLPLGWRVCGENLFAKHSIYYENLRNYFYLFGVFNDENLCANWSSTQHWANTLNVPTVPVIHYGLFEDFDHNEWRSKTDTDKVEGYVIRLAETFPYADFGKSIAKWVRKNHVKTDQHWTKQPIIPNRLFDT